ncbi:conserved hypothetical protein [Leishmania mexicana MHOM/GT/2001/U1103]|uniref:Uncharacterized protein n=1 Tax=Leishmania mexicana (strain MHOM/GT/2001/U1103) TaxID=929439 RepID=E9AJ99_LEIMU|nr:conserved hypothetical protein [Leishmania mexicana MHOM/GT/2001/U1103]CBZ22996.1 conserved hypothetical protein [Leishmania mexicana MHOM/GT/2001/U1103]
MALTQSSSAPLRCVQGGVGDASYADGTGQVPGRINGASATPLLTEEAVQSSIATFEDAAWVREEAVRSFAEFHNNVESLHATMRTQLRPVWRTAMQLRPDILADVRDEWRLRRRDIIPDGIPIPAAAVQHIARQETILSEVEDTLQALRNTSVRFAAHFLSDEEKISMGANPAYLRAPDIDKEVVVSRSQSTSTSTQRAVPASVISFPSSAGAVASAHVKPSGSSAAAAAVHTPREEYSRRYQGSRAQHYHHQHDDEAGLVSSSSNRHMCSGKSSCASRGASDDPLLEELRKQYQLRTRELKAQNEAGGSRRSEPGASRSAAEAPPRRGNRARVAASRSLSLTSRASSASASVLTSSSSTGSRR